MSWKEILLKEKMKMKVLIISLVFSIFSITYLSAAAFDLFLTPAPSGGTISASYDTTTSIVDTIAILHNKKAVDIAFGFSTGASNNYTSRFAADPVSGDTINYQIYDNLIDRHVVTDNFSSSTDWFFTDSYGTESNITHYYNFAIEVPSGQSSTAGTYTDTVTLNLNGGTNYTTNYDTVSYVITITIGPIAQIIVDSSGTNALTLPLDNGTGTVTNLKVATITEISSNSTYSVTLVSTNAGKLIGQAVNPDELPYTATYDGTSITLSATPQTISDNLPATDIDGIAKDFAISYTIIDSVLSEDTYSDTLTFTIIGN